MLYARTLLAAALALHGGNALVMPSRSSVSVTVPRSALSTLRACAAAEMPCAAPDTGVLMNDVPVSGATLRSMDLADRQGARVRSSSLIGEDGKAVVVFLRHLG